MRRNCLARVALIAPGIMLLSVQPAFAYLDPGTGSMILQAIIGGIVGGLIAIKVYWHKVKAFFSGSNTKADDKTN